MSVPYSFRQWLAVLLLIGATLSVSAIAQPVITSQPQDGWRAQVLRAIEAYRQTIERDPQNVKAHFELGKAYQQLHMWRDAVTAYEATVRLTPDHQPAHYQLGWGYTQLRRYDDALQALQQAVQLKNKDAPAQAALGWVYYCQRRYDEALAAYQAALRINPEDAGVEYELGRTYLAQGNQEAVSQQHEKLGKTDRVLAEYLLREVKRGPAAAPTDIKPPLIVPPGTMTGGAGSGAPANAGGAGAGASAMPQTRRPTILYKERAKYTEQARRHRISGVVVLSIVYTTDGQITNIRVVQGLPFGLSEAAIDAAQRIRFSSAIRNGQPITVRGNIEFTFSLYS